MEYRLTFGIQLLGGRRGKSRHGDDTKTVFPWPETGPVSPRLQKSRARTGFSDGRLPKNLSRTQLSSELGSRWQRASFRFGGGTRPVPRPFGSSRFREMNFPTCWIALYTYAVGIISSSPFLFTHTTDG